MSTSTFLLYVAPSLLVAVGAAASWLAATPTHQANTTPTPANSRGVGSAE
ncbi:hypothetical protein [Ancylobacter terrae]